MSIESVMPSSHLILCHPLLLLTSVFPSIGVFSNEINIKKKKRGGFVSWSYFWSFLCGGRRAGILVVELWRLQGSPRCENHQGSEVAQVGVRVSARCLLAHAPL